MQYLFFYSDNYEESESESFPWVTHSREFRKGDSSNRRTTNGCRNQVILGNRCSSWYSSDHQNSPKFGDKDKQGTANKVINLLQILCDSAV